MKISVIITVYNRTTFFRAALESALRQWPQPEVIVVDDGSEAVALEELNLILADYPSVLLMRNTTNQGVSAARNLGMATAKGEWVLFLDDDDLLAAGYFQQLLETKTMDADVIICQSELMLPADNVRSRRLLKLHQYQRQFFEHTRVQQPGYFLIYFPAIHAFLFRKSVLIACPFPDQVHYGEDRMLLLRLRNRVPMLAVNVLAARYRIHDNGSVPSLIWLDLAQQEGLLKNHFERSYAALLSAYIWLGRGKLLHTIWYMLRACTSAGVIRYLLGYVFFRARVPVHHIDTPVTADGHSSLR